MRTHTYWKSYKDYLVWSKNPPTQPSYNTQSQNGGFHKTRVHIKFID